jgi:mannonate dehydratase
MRTILDASCVDPGAASIDRAFVARLDALADASPPGLKLLLFAMEQAHDDAGRPDRERTTVHVPDRYAAEVAARRPQRFGWVASIHPYRDDAVERIDAARAGGAVALKWLPSAMNIDLRDPRCTRVYDRLAALDLPLVVHCGEERAVPGARREALVNPLLVRVPLERGVRVVVAHCASLGSAQDLDRPAQPQAAAFDLFARLMGERAHEGRLFGDTSAVFQINRRPEVRRALLERHDWHARLLHGSDWPLPGLRPLVSLTRLHAEGLLAEADIEPLDALREHHPVLFDLALKRSLRAGDRGLPAVTFATRGFFERAPKVAAGHMP